jgi:hypothetical protein
VSRTLQVEGDNTFRITIPDDCKITFGPWSPPTGKERSGYGESGRARGTLRIYQGTKENIIGCFSNVLSFRETTAIDYSEQVAKEEGAVLWKSDKDGYQREEKVKRETEWANEPKALAPGKKGKK